MSSCDKINMTSLDKINKLYNELDMLCYELEYIKYSQLYHYNTRLSCWPDGYRIDTIEEAYEKIEELGGLIKQHKKYIREECAKNNMECVFDKVDEYSIINSL